MAKYRIIYIPNGEFLYEYHNHYKTETYEQFLVTTSVKFNKNYPFLYLLEGDYNFISSVYAMLGWKTSVIFNSLFQNSPSITIKDWFEIVEVSDVASQ